jgi:uncharacterized protein
MKQLKDLMYVVKSDADETAYIQEKFESARSYSRSFALTITPTMACNFACDYCFQGENKKSGVMSNETASKLMSFAEKKVNEKIKYFNVTWYGGEPLLAKDLIYGMSEYFKKICADNNINYSAGMVTNGYHLTRETVNRLFVYKINRYQVTLDGGRDWHDKRRHLHNGGPTFDVILDNLRAAAEIDNVYINIRVNIDSRNAGSVEDLLAALCEKGLNNRKNFSVYFAPVDVYSKECTKVLSSMVKMKDFAALESEFTKSAITKGLKKNPYPGWLGGACTAIKPNNFVILSNGDIHKCWNTVPYPEQRVCTIDTVDKVKENPLFQKWVSWTPFDVPECRDCLLLPNCSGACADFSMSNDVVPCTVMKHNLKKNLLTQAVEKGYLNRDEIIWD